jgi:hypothetical protein
VKSCFVCMPLIDDLRAIYYGAILKEVEALGGQCECVKADDHRRPGMVTEKVAKSLLNADVVIAVIYDPRAKNSINPNVMYELGVAHSFRKPTIVVADSADSPPFDIHDVEIIQLDFTRFKDERHRDEFLLDLRESLRRALRAPELQRPSRGRPAMPVNPITSQLSGSKIFVEDLPWLWGYCKVLDREREARTIWEITKDLYWPAESVFFASLKASIRDQRKHFFIVPESEGVRRKIMTIKKQLLNDQITEEEIEQFLRFVAIDPRHFELWPIATVLYDADLATKRSGIICEPMTSEVGQDSFDEDIKDLFIEHVKSGGSLETFQVDLDWVQRRREATFDICLAGQVVEALATSFARIWNNKILEEAKQKSGDDQSALIKTWLIGA